MQKKSKMKVEQMTRDIKPMIDEANEMANQMGQQVVFSYFLSAGSN